MPTAKPVQTDDATVSEVAFLVLPRQTFLYLTEEAAKRNLSLAQLISSAVDSYLGQTKSKE